MNKVFAIVGKTQFDHGQLIAPSTLALLRVFNLMASAQSKIPKTTA
jgi:hypothetical protein